jgi:quercetin dioxygenase-like cupin family protein
MLEKLKCHTTTLAAGQAPHSSHVHPEEELIIVTEGELTATFSGKEKKADTGSMIFFASEQEHGLRNSGQARAVYSVIRWRARKT